MKRYTAEQKLKELRRELGMRYKVYGNAMTEERREQIAILQEVIDDYKALVAEQPHDAQGDLFG